MVSTTNLKAGISLLFVEDDEVILDLEASLISARFPDIRLYTAVNGRLGLELFHAHQPEIIITDINMAEMCGVEMVDNIRAIKPETKFIAISGKTYEANENGKYILRNSIGKNIEFNYYIVKPVDLGELFLVIEKCISAVAQETTSQDAAAGS